MNEQNLTAEELLCKEVEEQFLRLQEERKQLERSWELNVNFVNGNQYCTVAAGELTSIDKTYDWEQRRVFNHIAPVVDIRLSKLSRIRPALAVRAASDEEGDRKASELASAILSVVQEECDFDGVMSEATMWSEICGTAFYKIVWNSNGGIHVGSTETGKAVKDGCVKICAVSPFEIYPASLTEESLENQTAMIHAKILPVETVADMYGVELAGRDISEFPLHRTKLNTGATFNEKLNTCTYFELVLERYMRPTAANPNGRLTVVAGGKLLYDGELPYVNGTDGARGYPFIKQISQPVAGSFFGGSVVERLIPVQRAYNAVKNRKHEYLNRISMGTVAVEDGSVDIDEFADGGLAPGKVIIYRQGGTPPEMLTLGNVPEEFWKEEESLLSEFTKISGAGDLSENADSFAGVTSATGLQLIIEQDDARLNVAYQSLKRAVKNMGRQVLRLYRQFASDVRLMRYASSDGQRLLYFKGSDISCDDVVLDADTDLNMTPAQRRTVIYELMDRGLFSDNDGRMSLKAKRKILEILGYASLADVVPAETEGEQNDN